MYRFFMNFVTTASKSSLKSKYYIKKKIIEENALLLIPIF